MKKVADEEYFVKSSNLVVFYENKFERMIKK